MATIKTFNLMVNEMEEILTQALDTTIGYILANKITLEQLEQKKSRLAIILRKKSFWERLFDKKDENDPLAIYVVEVQAIKNESEST